MNFVENVVKFILKQVLAAISIFTVILADCVKQFWNDHW